MVTLRSYSKEKIVYVLYTAYLNEYEGLLGSRYRRRGGIV